MKTEIGTIQTVDLRAVWPKEASAFTPWLASNLHYLTDVIGLDLELVETEARVGDFSLDILAKDLSSDKLVAVENQFRTTNHDHLGKLLTYSAGYNVGTVIWIAESFRDEHRQALDWLNERSTEDVNYFGLVLELIRVDESKPAVILRPVAMPNEWMKEKRRQRNNVPSQLGETYREFFQPIVDEVRKSGFKGMVKARAQYWIQFGSSASGVLYSLAFSKKGLRAELYLGTQNPEWNRRVFDWLQQQSQQLETEKGFAEVLVWEPLDGRAACRVAVYLDDSDAAQVDQWSQYRQWGIDHLRHMKRLFDPLLDAYAITGGQ